MQTPNNVTRPRPTLRSVWFGLIFGLLALIVVASILYYRLKPQATQGQPSPSPAQGDQVTVVSPSPETVPPLLPTIAEVESSQPTGRDSSPRSTLPKYRPKAENGNVHGYTSYFSAITSGSVRAAAIASTAHAVATATSSSGDARAFASTR